MDLSDSRVYFVYRRVKHLTGLSDYNLENFVNSTANNDKLLEFYRSPEVQTLVVTEIYKGKLQIYHKLPVDRYGKSVIFAKKKNFHKPMGEEATNQVLLNCISFWDVGKSSLQHLMKYITELMTIDGKVPPPSKDENLVLKDRETGLLISDMMFQKKINQLKKETLHFQYRMNGQLHLPLPFGFTKYPANSEFSVIQSEEAMQSMLRMIENSVLSWDRLIDQFEVELKRNLKAANYLGEIYDAWIKMNGMLSDFFDILMTPERFRVVNILRNENSPFYNLLQLFLKKALEESDRVIVLMKPVVDYWQETKRLDFKSMQNKWVVLLEYMNMAWKKWTPVKLSHQCSHILVAIHNDLIKRIKDYLFESSSVEIDQANILEKLNNVKKTMKNYSKRVEKHLRLFTERNWPQPEVEAMDNYKKLQMRIDVLFEYFDWVKTYEKLSKLEIPQEGICPISLNKDDIIRLSKQIIQKFEDKLHLILNLNGEGETFFQEINGAIHSIDQNTIRYIDQLIHLNCETKSKLRILTMIEPILDRPTLLKGLEPTIESVLQAISKEFQKYNRNFERMCDESLTFTQRGFPKHKPKITAMLSMTVGLRREMSDVMEMIGRYLKPENQELPRVYEKMCEKMDAFYKKNVDVFVSSVSKNFHNGLTQKPFLIEENKKVVTNWNEGLFNAISETKEIFKLVNQSGSNAESVEQLSQRIHRDSKLQEINSNSTKLLNCHYMCESITHLINDIHDNARADELLLIAPKLAPIEALIEHASSNMTWQSGKFSPPSPFSSTYAFWSLVVRTTFRKIEP
ncbi:hypothetical protein Ciccas_010343 [Cichlidogyrus casuarinus]|uniref:Dynein heavy chain tail domain-containing protein n=1 Tax=Cichlidogyrus casuarinus TaxID=1844966 RepID=A0ABD2PXA8_9PLAT